jgi:uncharacterized protein
MSAETAGKILDRVFAGLGDGDEVTFAFQGGEPALAGLSWYRRFTEDAASRKKNAAVHYSFQTNGLLLDEAFCDFFRENNFLLGLSLDAGKRFHDRNRFSLALDGTYDACIRVKKLLEKKRVEYNILSVLTSDMAKEPGRVWRFIMNENIRCVQFIPCLEPPSEDAHPERLAGNVLRPALFAKFYTSLLLLWIGELKKGNYISVKFFDDVVNYFCKGIPTACGIDGRCHNQYVVEADGSVFPCDFYAFDKYRIGNLGQSAPGELSDAARIFLLEKPEPPRICASCGFSGACRGGCKRMRNVMYSGAGDAVCGLRSFLEKCLGPLELAARKANLVR